MPVNFTTTTAGGAVVPTSANTGTNVALGLISMGDDLQNLALVTLRPGVLDDQWKLTPSGVDLTGTISGGAGLVRHVAGNLGYVSTGGSATVTFSGETLNNPRIDSVYRLTDGTLQVVKGTQTAGATLDNRSGAGAAPSSSLLLYDVRFSSGSYPAVPVTFNTSAVRDRRPWARGIYTIKKRVGGALSSTDSVNWASSATDYEVRAEVQTGVVRVTFAAILSTLGNTTAYVGLEVDGAVDATDARPVQIPVGGGEDSRHFEWDVTGLAAGSHTFQPVWKPAAGGTIFVQTGDGALPFVVDEVTRHNASNAV